MNPEEDKYNPDSPVIGDIPIPASPLIMAFDDFEPISQQPQPLSILHETPVPPFLSKTFDLVDDQVLDPVISWGKSGLSFVVWDPVEFSRTILPRNFKHNNFSSFVRQLNTYGFRKVDADKWEFANQGFRQGQKHLLRNIQRRKSPQSSQQHISTHVGEPGLETEIERLKKERGTMMREVVELQQQQRGSIQHINTVNTRIQAAEQRQKQMLSFLAKLFRNPEFLDRLKRSKEQRTIQPSRTRRKLARHDGPESSDQGEIIKQPPLALGESLPVEMLDNFASDDFAMGQEEEEVVIPSDQIEEREELHHKGKTVVDPLLDELGPEYLVSFPDDLGIQDFPVVASSSGFDTNIKQEDVWSMGFDMEDFVQYGMPDFGATGGFSDFWDIGSTHGAGSSGVDEQLADESLFNENISGQPRDDRLNKLDP